MSDVTNTREGPYYYTRDKNGCDDTWDIYGPGDEFLATIPFWDEPDTAEWVRRTEATARLIVAALTAYKATVDLTEPPREGDQ
jgi:hypothetical protein